MPDPTAPPGLPRPRGSTARSRDAAGAALPAPRGLLEPQQLTSFSLPLSSLFFPISLPVSLLFPAPPPFPYHHYFPLFPILIPPIFPHSITIFPLSVPLSLLFFSPKKTSPLLFFPLPFSLLFFPLSVLIFSPSLLLPVISSLPTPRFALSIPPAWHLAQRGRSLRLRDPARLRSAAAPVLKWQKLVCASEEAEDASSAIAVLVHRLGALLASVLLDLQLSRLMEKLFSEELICNNISFLTRGSVGDVCRERCFKE